MGTTRHIKTMAYVAQNKLYSNLNWDHHTKRKVNFPAIARLALLFFQSIKSRTSLFDYDSIRRGKKEIHLYRLIKNRPDISENPLSRIKSGQAPSKIYISSAAKKFNLNNISWFSAHAFIVNSSTDFASTIVLVNSKYNSTCFFDPRIPRYL